MLVGALTQLILGRQGKATDWSMAIAAGLVGSIVGAVLVTAIWRWARSRQRA